MKLIWALLGLLALALALIGVVLPLLPTVPFLLLAAFCFARSSQKLHRWLISHKTFGPMIIAWTTSGAIGLSAKRYATLSILAVFSLSHIHWAKLEHINPARARPELCSRLYLDPTASLRAT